MRLEAIGLSAGYGRKAVIHEVSLRLDVGEFVGLIGPNGSGKSTLLRAISGVLPLNSGQVLLDGSPRDSLTRKQVAQQIAFVPQNEASVFDFTVRDVVLMGRYPHIQRGKGETAEDFEIAARAMATTDVLQIADRPITAISGGEQRRVLLARALAQSAPIMLLDEPTAHLDITHQIEILSTIRKLVDARRCTTLAALHDLNLAAEFCDRLILLNEGRTAAEGDPHRVLREDTLSDVYGSGLSVAKSPMTGGPVVLPKIGSKRSECIGPRIHVICGGGTGTAVLASLLRRGFQVTAGVLNKLDTDEAACAALGIDAAVELPFTKIGEAAREKAEELIASADAVLITEIPFGGGNLANLEMARAALENGKRVLLMGGKTLEGRDFSGGAANKVYNYLVLNGAIVVQSPTEIEHAMRGGRFEVSAVPG